MATRGRIRLPPLAKVSRITAPARSADPSSGAVLSAETSTGRRNFSTAVPGRAAPRRFAGRDGAASTSPRPRPDACPARDASRSEPTTGWARRSGVSVQVRPVATSKNGNSARAGADKPSVLCANGAQVAADGLVGRTARGDYRCRSPCRARCHGRSGSVRRPAGRHPKERQARRGQPGSRPPTIRPILLRRYGRVRLRPAASSSEHAAPDNDPQQSRLGDADAPARRRPTLGDHLLKHGLVDSLISRRQQTAARPGSAAAGRRPRNHRAPVRPAHGRRHRRADRRSRRSGRWWRFRRPSPATHAAGRADRVAASSIEVAQDVGQLEGAAQRGGRAASPAPAAMPKARDQPPDRAGHPIAVRVGRLGIGRTDVGGDVHRHAVDHRQEIRLPQAEVMNRVLQEPGAPGRSAGVESAKGRRASARARLPAPRAAACRRRRCRPPSCSSCRWRTWPHARPSALRAWRRRRKAAEDLRLQRRRIGLGLRFIVIPACRPAGVACGVPFARASRWRR